MNAKQELIKHIKDREVKYVHIIKGREYLGEDDIVRFECIYGRAGPNPNPEIPA